jgi:protein-tyrosine phosphatase
LIPARLRRLWPFRAAAREERIACRILFVCMGNVCRSPTAEAVFRGRVAAAGLADRIACTSAGTHGFNAGAAADARARDTAARRGYDMSKARGRAIAAEDFERYDLILAMDRQNLDALRERCPEARQERLRLLMEFARAHDVLEVPDPYYSNAQGFELVLDMIEDACGALLEHVRAQYIDTAALPADAAMPPRSG